MVNPTSRRGAWRKKALLVLFGLALALAVGEAFLRWAVPYRFYYKFARFEIERADPLPPGDQHADILLGPGMAPADGGIGYKLRPNMRARMVSSEFDIAVSTNAQGLRNGVIGPKTKTRVLFLGDSFTMGYGVEAEQAFPAVYGELAGPEVEVINGGIMGYNPYNVANFLEHEALDYKPDVVVVQFEPRGDVCIAGGPAEFVGKHQVPYKSTIKNFALRSHLVMLVVQRLKTNASTRRWLMNRGLLGRFDDDRIFNENFADICRDNLTRLDKLIGKMKNLCDEHGVELVFFLTPLREQIDADILRTHFDYNLIAYDLEKIDLTAPNRTLAELAAKHGVRLIDPTGRFRRECANTLCYFTGYDIHFTPRGHRLAAQSLIDAGLITPGEHP